MKQIGQGILPESEIYFSSPSQKAKKLYYNVLCAGHFYCDCNYHLVRNSYDSILILYVADGTFTFKNHEGNFVTAKKNDTVVLDCYNPHEYCTSDSLESIWMHVAGVNSRELCQEILNNSGNLIKTKEYEHIRKMILKVFDGIRNDNSLDDTELSLVIYELLLELLNPVSAKTKDERIHEKISKA